MIIRAIEDEPFSEACRSLWLEPNEVVIRDGSGSGFFSKIVEKGASAKNNKYKEISEAG